MPGRERVCVVVRVECHHHQGRAHGCSQEQHIRPQPGTEYYWGLARGSQGTRPHLATRTSLATDTTALRYERTLAED